ncbi:MAG: SIS domain-containing protein [Candidatus Aminicenantes bacterium]|nr:SIS domain-containing protein [Candidatus Aminicenantes bacterium]
MKELYGSTVADLNRVLKDFYRTSSGVLEAAAEAIARNVRAGGKVLLFGNGGSAAEAQHFAAELVNGMRQRDRPPIPAIALTTDTSSLTAIGNDRGFVLVFSRQVEALGRPGDVAVALTTSGTSPNVVEALKTARAKGLLTVALTGEGGGEVTPLADYLLKVPSRSTPRVQEAHLFILHLLAERLEESLGDQL